MPDHTDTSNKNFRFSQINNPHRAYLTLSAILSGDASEFEYDAVSQGLGVTDFLKSEIYEGDILELCITERLMDPMKSTFGRSNLGQRLSKLRLEERVNVLSVVLFMPHGMERAGCHYEVYYMLDSLELLKDDDGDIDMQARGTDWSFPAYLSEKGARVVTDIFQDPSALYKFRNYTLWGRIPELMQEYERRFQA